MAQEPLPMIDALAHQYPFPMLSLSGFEAKPFDERPRMHASNGEELYKEHTTLQPQQLQEDPQVTGELDSPALTYGTASSTSSTPSPDLPPLDFSNLSSPFQGADIWMPFYTISAIPARMREVECKLDTVSQKVREGKTCTPLELLEYLEQKPSMPRKAEGVPFVHMSWVSSPRPSTGVSVSSASKVT